ncbi:hypothetical protein BCR36DRAFT_410739 [Piromyces finnis]|uniref:Uncharacterized protein n=1 Tax=Piromyces finnis TaxID=1754191 RepID=A0A1Y1VFG6_9FUNG|nr:hypothetical protein BCR36DRAFT_410739 [Piromyces finnis]|eukprot:ORX54192.1 hypothetical protein BCR36DRAFT_410739 [Piromyces finnis]
MESSIQYVMYWIIFSILLILISTINFSIFYYFDYYSIFFFILYYPIIKEIDKFTIKPYTSKYVKSGENDSKTKENVEKSVLKKKYIIKIWINSMINSGVYYIFLSILLSCFNSLKITTKESFLLQFEYFMILIDNGTSLIFLSLLITLINGYYESKEYTLLEAVTNIFFITSGIKYPYSTIHMNSYCKLYLENVDKLSFFEFCYLHIRGIRRKTEPFTFKKDVVYISPDNQKYMTIGSEISPRWTQYIVYNYKGSIISASPNLPSNQMYEEKFNLLSLQ